MNGISFEFEQNLIAVDEAYDAYNALVQALNLTLVLERIFIGSTGLVE
jgi:hypothetical protein